jgi:NAD(P)-dependent dehydrogenase (short-subunit alcohol dehydrogenase family)
MSSAEGQINSVLITGATSGLGLEIALYLAERGFQVYATMPDLQEREALDEAATRRKVQLQVPRLDVTDQASIDAAVRATVEQSGGIYAVVNNAGIALRGYFEDLLDEEIRQVFEVNLFGTMAVTRAVLPYMRQARRGRIVTISSVVGRIGHMGRSAYAASKFALEGWGESLALELAPLGIQVVLIEPGIVHTARWTTNQGVATRALEPNSPYHAWFVQAEKMGDDLLRVTPTTPADVAKAVHQALTARQPRMRYIVGRKANLVVLLRRYLPNTWFERFYFGEIIRRVTASTRR